MGIVLVLLAIPLILRWVPPNSLYGLRTPYVSSSDEVWYRANVTAGKALLVAGFVSIAADFVLIQIVESRRTLSTLSTAIFAGAALVSCFVSIVLVYRDREHSDTRA